VPAGTITALRVQAKDKQRVNVFIDGAFALGVSLNTLTREQLFVGKQLDEAAFTRLEASESSDKAYLTALQLLASRPRSAHEVADRLGRKGFAPEAADAAVARLRDLGLIDDAAFARSFVENRLTFRPKGASALRQELRRKGIDQATADEVLADDELLGDEAARAATVARAALRRYADAADRATFARRLGGYLLRRGFTYETVGPLLEQLWQEVQKERHDDDL
jgi:regulatory protein